MITARIKAFRNRKASPVAAVDGLIPTAGVMTPVPEEEAPVEVEEEEIEEEPEPEDEIEEVEEDLSDYTVSELKAMLDEAEIEYDSDDRKADLIAKLS